MSNKFFFLFSFFLFLFSASCHGIKNKKTTQHNKPNIVYILADDLGYGDLSCYGQTHFSTPNIDKLAQEGMLFTQHYAGSTVCAPSRSSLMTGMDTGHTPIRGNKETETGQLPLPKESYTVAELLKENGYATGAFGKWGLGASGSEGDPLNQGFDTFFGYHDQKLAHHYYPY
jgi:arylsulfatase A-like enzyme